MGGIGIAQDLDMRAHATPAGHQQVCGRSAPGDCRFGMLVTGDERTGVHRYQPFTIAIGAMQMQTAVGQVNFSSFDRSGKHHGEVLINAIAVNRPGHIQSREIDGGPKIGQMHRCFMDHAAKVEHGAVGLAPGPQRKMRISGGKSLQQRFPLVIEPPHEIADGTVFGWGVRIGGYTNRFGCSGPDCGVNHSIDLAEMDNEIPAGPWSARCDGDDAQSAGVPRKGC